MQFVGQHVVPLSSLAPSKIVSRVTIDIVRQSRIPGEIGFRRVLPTGPGGLVGRFRVVLLCAPEVAGNRALGRAG